jgi:uncharacterized membrane protein YcjF (UPF0283 family)
MAQERAKGKEGAEERVTTSSTTLTTVAVVVAVVLIAAYLIALFLQWLRIDLPDLAWARGLDLLGGLEALAFAAAGALFGTTVQRQVTEKAEREASAATKRADENEKAAEAGRAVVKLARIKAGPETAAPGRRRSIDARRDETSARDIAELAALGERYGITD